MIDITELGDILAEISRISQGHYLYNWSGIFEDRSLIDIEKIYIRNVGAVDIPVPPETILAIEKEYSKLQTQHDFTAIKEAPPNSCIVESSEIFIIPGNKRKLSEMMSSLSVDVLSRMLNIDMCNLTQNFEATLDQLVICRAGQSVTKSMNNRKQPGMFGTLHLQLPIKTDYPSGQLIIKDAAQETEVDFQENNRNSFHVAAIAGTSQDEGSQSTTVSSSHPTGMVLLLIFNLGWKGCISPGEEWMSSFFPKYLSVSHKLSKSLRSWNEVRGGSLHPSPVNTLCYRQGTNANESDLPSFLCFPLANSYGPEPSAWILTGQDLLVLKILDMVNFIDVNFAILKRKSPTSSSSRDIGPIETSTLLFTFQKGHFRKKSIKDGLFSFAFNLRNHLISREETDDVISVLVIRPHSLNFRIPRKLTLEELQSEFLLTDDTSSESISRDLEIILDALPNMDDQRESENSPVNCVKCILLRLLITCTELKNQKNGLRVLLQLCQLKNLFGRCDQCGIDLNNPSPAVIFANFICLASGCGMHFPLNLLLKKLDAGSLSDYCQLGIKLVQGGRCAAEAREVFQHLYFHLETIPRTLDTDGQHLNVDIFKFAIILHDALHDDTVIEMAYQMASTANLSTVICVIEHLADNAKSMKNVHFYLRGFGMIVAEKIPSSFDHLLKALKLYHDFGEETILQLIWTNICSRCIEIYNDEEVSETSNRINCFFCRLLLTTMDEDDSQIKTMVYARNSQDALGCAIDKVTEINSGSSFHYKEVLSFVRRIIQMQDVLPVYFHEERMTGFCSLFTCIHSEDLCELINSTLGHQKDLRRTGSVKSQLVEHLVAQLLNRKDFALTSPREHVLMALEFCIWYNDLNLLKNFLMKLDGRFSTVQSETMSSFFTLIAIILKEGVEKLDPTSAAINRDAFSLLTWKWIKLLRKLKTGRVQSFLDCFQTTFKLEKKLKFFSKPENLNVEFAKSIADLSFSETLEILKTFFTSEFGEDIICNMKMLSTSLKIFRGLCNQANEMIDAEKATHLPVETLITVMQCFLWLGEEKPIVEFTRLLVNLPCSVSVGEALEAIIFEENTADLAAGSPFGVVALGNIIDYRIRQLSPASKSSKKMLSRICPRLLNRNSSSKRSNNARAELQPGISKDNTGSSAKVEQLQQLKEKFLKGLCRD